MPSEMPSRRRLLQLAPAILWSAPAFAERVPSSPEPVVAYYSDYYSFVGRDAKGHVYLALDTNRGRYHDSYQANHFVVMYDEATGWVDLKGNVVYPNPGKVLDGLPASEHFSFEGRAATGTVISGREGGLRLTVEPLPETLKRQNADGIFWIGGAPAILEWNGRRLEGRVIFEYLQRNNFNYFTAKPDRSWRNFNGLYLLTEDGRDFYVHFHERQGGSDLTGRLVGMASWGRPAAVSKLDFRIVETAAVPYRTYRWPIAWQVSFEHEGVSYVLDLYTAERKLSGDWETGGFAMCVARGTITSIDARRTIKVAGWAELLI
jgi:hypothetical protein